MIGGIQRAGGHGGICRGWLGRSQPLCDLPNRFSINPCSAADFVLRKLVLQKESNCISLVRCQDIHSMDPLQMRVRMMSCRGYRNDRFGRFRLLVATGGFWWPSLGEFGWPSGLRPEASVGGSHRTCAPGMARYFVGESPMARFSQSRRQGEGQGRHREVGSIGAPNCEAARR